MSTGLFEEEDKDETRRGKQSVVLGVRVRVKDWEIRRGGGADFLWLKLRGDWNGDGGDGTELIGGAIERSSTDGSIMFKTLVTKFES